MTSVRRNGESPFGIARQSWWDKALSWTGRFNVYDVACLVLIAALTITAFFTFRDYAISNDEDVQHHYGMLIIAYYTSGFADLRLFNFQNLYLYGGLFDIVAVLLSHLMPLDPFDLRHILCALIGIGGIGAAAATARLIAGPRAALIAVIALASCGVWYGAMFNHTKDIPFATAMAGATFFLIRVARNLPRPRAGDVIAFGLFAGASLGMRVLGLLLAVYAVAAIVIYLPRQASRRARLRFALASVLRLLPALVLAYVIMILAWPWASLAPLNPIRALFAFSEFQYGVRTSVDGHVYMMANVPRLYVPIYILIRMPLIVLFGAALALVGLLWPRIIAASMPPQRRDVALVALTVVFPLACQVILHGPAFAGLRHFLFVVAPLAVLAGIGFDRAMTALASRRRLVTYGAIAVLIAGFASNAVTLVRLHPYEYLFYNPLVGGLEGASRRYDLDYWFGSMPEAIGQLESYLRRSEPAQVGSAPSQVYSVAVCGERLPFEKAVTLPQLRWDFKSEWDESEFFIAPTHMNCDRVLDGKIIGVVERLGVPIAYVKDRRALIRTTTAAAR